MTNNTIPNVPRELLADLLGNDHDKRIMAERHLLAMLANAPSPAGVDGWDVAGDILEKLSAAQAIIDGLQEKIERLQFSLEVAKTDELSAAVYAETESIKHSLWDAEKERYKKAQRIGELERALLEVAASLAWNAHGECRAIHDGPIMPSKMAIDVAKAALSAGKEGE